MFCRPNTQTLYETSAHLMPGGVNSPVRAFKGLDLLPLIVKEGKGDLLYDVDEHAYIDFCGSWGALILGHAHQAVVSAVVEQAFRGTSFGIATPFERDLAERIMVHLKSIEKIRFVSSGTEAAMTAIRLARGFTNKPTIVKFNGHYHGHSDSLLVKAGSGVSYLPQASSKGVVDSLVQFTLSLPFNDLSLCQRVIRARDDIACVIVEPVAGNMGVVPAKPQFLEMLREETARKGIVLIFDEVMTGFRVALSGAQGYYGIAPDLTCLGKVIGGGLPAAALGGQQEIMDYLAPLGPVYQAGTLSGNPLAMRAGLATLSVIEQFGFFRALQEKLEAFLEPVREVICQAALPIAIQSAGSMFTLFFGPTKVESQEDLALLDTERFKHFFTYLFERGVYLSPSPYEAHFLCSAHTQEHLAKTQRLILEYLEKYF